MKVLLIYPYCLDERIFKEDVRVPPIGLYYVGAVLREAGYDCEVLNVCDLKGDPEGIRRILREKAPRVIGLSVLQANRWGAVEIARLAKEVDPEVTVVFGGVAATLLWEHFLRHFPEVDLCVLGEGEYSFLKVVQAIEGGDHEALEKIPGLAMKKEGALFKTGEPERIEDLDQLPDPARHFTFQHVTSSRGCPGNCAFCGSPRLWGRRVRFHSPAYFVDQLERLYRKGVRFFYFSDDTFTLDRKRAVAICREIMKRGLRISWAAIAHVHHVDEEVLAWMRRAGCIQISYGVESGSERIRAVLHKPIQKERIIQAFAWTARYGIFPRAYFIYACPGESWETIEETIDLMRAIKPLGMISYILDIIPGTALYEDFLRRTGLTDDIWLEVGEDIPYFETDPRLNPERVLAFGQKLRTAFYENLPAFAEGLDLIEEEAFFPLHADFLSRLGLTFSHGDYARIEAVPHKEETAQRLYERSLTYAPEARAYLGLGMLRQKARRFEDSVRILSEGVGHFPDHESLHLCLAVSLMNLGRYREALSHLEPFAASPQAGPHLAECRRVLGLNQGDKT